MILGHVCEDLLRRVIVYPSFHDGSVENGWTFLVLNFEVLFLFLNPAEKTSGPRDNKISLLYPRVW